MPSIKPIYEDFRADLIVEGWKTPDTYDSHYGYIERQPAVYMFLVFKSLGEYKTPDFRSPVVAYVGMTRDLKQRLAAHEVLRDISKTGQYYQRWFLPTVLEELRYAELQLIRRFDPPWNFQGRERGDLF